MRNPMFRGWLDSSEITVDNFAGGGGVSTGVAAAVERPVEIAINHDPEAIACHAANHPETKHYLENIFEVDPREACAGRPVGVAWFSPDCTHHSRAKGDQPRSNELRGLAKVAITWGQLVAPRIIVVENVMEFEDWGPLDKKGKPIKGREGEDFRAWVAALIDLGYKVEWRVLCCADYGAPTTRRRLFVIARRDGAPIVWPEPTHGEGRPLPWRAAAEIIDWSLDCPSIFLTKEEARGLGVKRPLAEATLNRIAVGVDRYVINCEDPFFILPTTHQGDARVHSIREPMRTITGAHRGEYAVAKPFLVRHGHYSTITGAGLRRGCGGAGSRRGAPGIFRGQPLDRPLATVCATNDKHLVVPFVAKHYGGVDRSGRPKAVGSDVRRPLSTVTAKDHNYLTAAFMTKFYGTSTGSSMRAPCPTVTANDKGGGHLAEVRAFMVKYYGSGGSQSPSEPLHTVTAKARFGLIMVAGDYYHLADIGMRMLQPAELFAAQAFPTNYIIAPNFHGKPLTKTAQTRLAGNSVPPCVARAIVHAQLRSAA